MKPKISKSTTVNHQAEIRQPEADSQPTEDEPEVLLQQLLEQFDEQTGEYWGDWVQWLKGEFVGEFTDIKHTTTQMIMNWSAQSGEPLGQCMANFASDFVLEIINLAEQHCFENNGEEGVYETTDHPNRWPVGLQKKEKEAKRIWDAAKANTKAN